MTSRSLSRSGGDGVGTLTYARSRLYLGISGVGTAVVAAACLLYFDIPSVGFATTTEQSVGRSLFAVGLFFAMSAGLFFLFDLLGGAWVVRRKANAPLWLAAWGRGVAVQWTVWMLTAAALMLTARAAGTTAAIGVFVVIQFALALFRGTFVRIIASFSVHTPPPVFAEAAERAGIPLARLKVVDTADEGFVGGWSSLLPRTLVVPRRWELLPADVLAAQLARRAVVAESGAHVRGVLGAILFNTLGFVVVLQLTGAAPATAAGIVTIMAGMTLWAFLGVLVLPTPSRAAVYAADAAAAATVGVAAVKTSIERLDKWQDDEPTRTPNIERIFHPVPARANRLARLDGERRGLSALHAHNLARHALWLGWGGFSAISRAVHCNVGRTALWAMLPGD
jgi:hypothetical protein